MSNTKATRYRLPDALGGGEYEECPPTVPAPYGTCAFLLALDGSSINPSTDGGYVVYVAKDLLTEVKPPLPLEPVTNGTVVRLDGGGLWARSITGTGANWLGVHSRQLSTWSELCQLGTPVVLVPDPFAEPVELPWEDKTKCGVTVGVRALDTGNVNVWMTPEDVIRVATVTGALARDMARALWVAAAEATT